MRPTTARVDQGSSALQSLRERPWGGERSSAHVQHGLTGTVGVGRPRYGPTPLHPPRKRCLRTAQRKKSHVMRPSTARAVTASLQVIFTRSRCILLTPPLHCRRDSRRGWHGWALCASPPRAGPCPRHRTGVVGLTRRQDFVAASAPSITRHAVIMHPRLRKPRRPAAGWASRGWVSCGWPPPGLCTGRAILMPIRVGAARSVNHWEGHARGAMRPAERLTADGQVTSDRHAGGG
jgi:hypothetical protein